jgi:anti-sigma B factor antagonist
MVAFDVAVEPADGRAVVVVHGELDIATTPRLEDVLASTEGGGVEDLIVDLSPTTFCDSSGMAAVLRAHRRAEARGARLVLVCPAGNRDVSRVIRLLGLDEVFELRETRDAADAALDGR